MVCSRRLARHTIPFFSSWWHKRILNDMLIYSSWKYEPWFHYSKPLMFHSLGTRLRSRPFEGSNFKTLLSNQGPKSNCHCSQVSDGRVAWWYVLNDVGFHAYPFQQILNEENKLSHCQLRKTKQETSLMPYWVNITNHENLASKVIHVTNAGHSLVSANGEKIMLL